jgi:hypothetical protein
VYLTLLRADALSGIAATYWSKDNGGFNRYTGTIGFSISGWRHIVYYSVDEAGNVEEQHELNLPIDNIPPVLASPTVNGVPYAQAQRTLVGPVQIALGAVDTYSGLDSLSYRIGDGAWVRYSGPFVLSTPGAYTVRYQATDRAGNSTATASIHLTVARLSTSVVASVSGTQGTAGWYRSAVSVSLAPSPAGTTAQYRIDGGPVTAYAGPFTVSGDGRHQVEYQALGSTGATAWLDLAITIDTNPPATTGGVAGSQPNSAGWYNHPVTVQLSATDATSGVATTYWQKDNSGDFTAYGGPLELGNSGNRVITYYSVDQAGNVEGAHTLTIHIDQEAPQTTATINGGPLVAGAYTNLAQIQLRAVDDLSGIAATYISVDGAAPSTLI